ncbi:MAG: serine/threonine-protein kinase [Planctomycetota bacterium]|nr:serine/threonine-protein kinase [Planctomycetota bacterium]
MALRVGVDMDKQTRVSEWKPEPFVGRTFDGYRVEGLIGVGGMGAVYKATQLSLNRSVALKVLGQALVGDPQFRERFHREADALSRLSHPNIVTVIDRGELDGQPYLVMEYVEGANLRSVMKQGPLSPAEALQIVSSVLEALQHAHGQGIVHRDIKPENVLLSRGSLVKVADFGLSRLLGPAESTRLTHTHVVLGTYEYMSPEQREKAKEADERSDIYATGVILYEMLTGELPIGRFKPPSELRKGCSTRIDALIDKALEKDPAARYQRASEMGGAVSAVLARPSVQESSKTILSVGAGGFAPPVVPEAVPAPESTEVPSSYRPQRFENHIHNLITMNRVIGSIVLLIGMFFMASMLLYRAQGSLNAPLSIASLLGVGMFLATLLLWWTAKRLGDYDPHGRSWQASLSVVAGCTGVLLPYTIYSFWVLYGHRGRAYFDARSRGLDSTAAAVYAYNALEGGSGPVMPPVRDQPPCTGIVCAAYVWWLVGLMVAGIVAQTAGSYVLGLWTSVWLGITVLLGGIGLFDCLTHRKRGAGAAACVILLCLITLAVLKLMIGV